MDTFEHVDSGIERTRDIRRVLWTVLILNVVVALAKFIYGSLTGTMSMRADGIHSLFDGLGNIVGIIGILMASRPADYEHPYGHAKFETIASVVIGLLLLLAAYNVASSAIAELKDASLTPDVTPISFVVMLATLSINICVTRWERRESKRLSSEILGADSRHTLSDVLVTCGVIIGLVFIRLGYVIVDPIMSLIVACAILYTAFEVFRQANSTLSDTARIPAETISGIAENVEGVRTCHKVRTRGSEAEVYVDLHVLVDPRMSVWQAHENVAEEIERRVKDLFPQVVEVMVHIEPDVEHERAEGR